MESTKQTIPNQAPPSVPQRLFSRLSSAPRVVVVLGLAFLLLAIMLFVWLRWVGASADWYNDDWGYRQLITVDSTMVAGSSALTDFAVLVSLEESPELAGRAASGGDDILFTAADGTTKLNHELQEFDEETGALVAWVRVPTLSHNTNTELYMYYGNHAATEQQNPTAVWDSYVGVWHMNNDPTVSDILDSTTNGNDGVLNGAFNSSSLTDGKIGRALDFNGSDNVVRVPDSPSTSIEGNQFTLSAWVYPTDLGCGTASCDHGFVSKAHESASNQERYHLGANRDGAIAARRYSSGSQEFGSGSAGDIVNNQWQFVTAIYNGAESTFKAYVDGVEVMDRGVVTGDIDPSNDDLLFGKRYNARFFSGLIDEVRISDIPRSVEWIQTEFNNQNDPQAIVTFSAEETNVSVAQTVYRWYESSGALLPGVASGDFNQVISTAGDTMIRLRMGIEALQNIPAGAGNFTLQYATNPSSEWRDVSGVDGAATAPTNLLDWYHEDWDYRKSVTINHTEVAGTGSHENFPVLVSIASDSDIASNAQASGNDIVFTDAYDAKLSHEIEHFDSTTGQLKAWVRVPHLATAQNTQLYVYYGNAGATNQQDVSAVWDGQPYAAVYHLSNDDFTDSTRYGNDGTNNGSTAATGKIAEGREFDGSGNNEITAPHTNSLQAAHQLTLSAWIRPDANGASSGSQIIGKDHSGGGVDYGIKQLSGNEIRFTIRFAGNYYDLDSIATIPLNEWTHVVATYDRNEAMMRIYFNGQEVASRSESISRISDQGNNLMIGVDTGDQTFSRFSGIIDEPRVMHGRLDADWIETEYNNQQNPSAFHSIGSQEALSAQAGTAQDWYHSGWGRRKLVTVDSDQVSGTSNINDFSLLVKIDEDSELAAQAQASGADILFTDLDGTKLEHELQLFDDTTGELVAWVRLPVLSHDIDTQIRMYFDNGVAYMQDNSVMTWLDIYRNVDHKHDETSSSIRTSTLTPMIGEKTAANDPQQVPGKIGFAQDYNGTSSKIRLGRSRQTAFDLDSSDTLTLSAWIYRKANGQANTSVILGKATQNGGQNWGLGLTSNNRAQFKVTTDITANREVTSSASVPLEQWTHVAGVYDGSNMRVYVNGQESGTNTLTGVVQSVLNRPMTYGADEHSPDNRRFEGIIDEPRVSAVAKSDAWLATEQANQADPGSFITVSAGAVPEWDYDPGEALDPEHGAALDSTILFGTNVTGTFNRTSPIAPNATAVSAGDVLEIDFALNPTNATPGATYYFRLVDSATGEPLDQYKYYPQITITESIITEQKTRHGGSFVDGVRQPFELD